MKLLADIKPTPEQLKIIRRFRPGNVLIRGAAGSGKTSTALLRLRSLVGSWLNRRERLGIEGPVNVLVLTFNRTLRGYIQELANKQVDDNEGLNLTISTFGKWSHELLNKPRLVNKTNYNKKIRTLGAGLPLNRDFISDEVAYASGRFPPDDIYSYLTCRRDGRGASPRVDRTTRNRIIEDIILPYNKWKSDKGLSDWNDLAVELSGSLIGDGYDIIICDEAQDFSANQIRAINKQLKDEHSLTLVMDAAQRIYPQGFSWTEVGLRIRPEDTYRLSLNYRNTVEIAKFALPLIDNLELSDDGTIPDFNSCIRSGEMPKVIIGLFREQVEFVINHIQSNVDLAHESVAFLHPRGWFAYLEGQLKDAGLDYVTISRESEWPEGDENIALCTLHSAKGLEFDHVFILGLNHEVTIHGTEEDDDQLERLRRLLAMAIGRAYKTATLGYKPNEESSLINYLDKDTFEEVNL